MSTELDLLISNTYKSIGKQEDVNKVYLAFLRTTFFIPVEKKIQHAPSSDEADLFNPLFAKFEENYFMVIFDRLERLQDWAQENINKMDYVQLNGQEVITGINEFVFLCLNVGSPTYKEFSPDEIKKLKQMVAKIEQMKKVNFS